MNGRMAILLVIIGLLTLFAFGTVHAQMGEGYDLTWNTIDNGGGASDNGGYTLNGTIGQTDASRALSNAGYALMGGFWNTIAQQYSVYLPLVLRGP